MDHIRQIAGVYKALSDPTRLQILKLLADHDRLCVNAITDRLRVTQSAVSQHLRVLRQTELVQGERVSVRVHYSLNRERLEQFGNQVASVLGDAFVPT